LGDVTRDRADANDAIRRIDASHRGSDAPAQLAVRTADTKLALEARRIGRRRLDRVLHVLPILGMDQRPHIIDGELETRGIDAENSILPVVPEEPAIDWIPFSRSHLAGGQR